MALSRGGWVLLAAAIAVVLGLTLAPAPGVPTAGMFSCFFCGRRGVADAINNVLLLVPVGVALALVMPGMIRPMVVAVGLSATVELIQIGIPGRDANVVDLLFNSIGSGTGLSIVRSAKYWLLPRRVVCWVLCGASASAAIGVVMLSGLLLEPAPSKKVHEILLTPESPTPPPYSGTLVHAFLGSLSLTRSELVPPHALQTLLAAGARLELHVTRGPVMHGLAPIIILNAREKEELVLIGVQGSDLVVRFRTRAASLLLDQPDLRLRGALRNAAQGDTLEIALWKHEGLYCVAVDAVHQCGMGYSIGQGWALLLYRSSWPRRIQDLLSAGWLAALLVPVGFWAPMHRAVVLIWLACLGTIIIVPGFTATVATSLQQVTGAVVGVIVGLTLRVVVERRAAAIRSYFNSRISRFGSSG